MSLEIPGHALNGFLMFLCPARDDVTLNLFSDCFYSRETLGHDAIIYNVPLFGDSMKQLCLHMSFELRFIKMEAFD